MPIVCALSFGLVCTRSRAAVKSPLVPSRAVLKCRSLGSCTSGQSSIVVLSGLHVDIATIHKSGCLSLGSVAPNCVLPVVDGQWLQHLSEWFGWALESGGRAGVRGQLF